MKNRSRNRGRVRQINLEGGQKVDILQSLYSWRLAGSIFRHAIFLGRRVHAVH